MRGEGYMQSEGEGRAWVYFKPLSSQKTAARTPSPRAGDSALLLRNLDFAESLMEFYFTVTLCIGLHFRMLKPAALPMAAWTADPALQSTQVASLFVTMPGACSWSRLFPIGERRRCPCQASQVVSVCRLTRARSRKHDVSEGATVPL